MKKLIVAMIAALAAGTAAADYATQTDQDYLDYGEVNELDQELVILPLDEQLIVLGEAATPSVVVSNVSSHVTYNVAPGDENEFFELSYTDNTLSGNATVTVTGKTGSACEGMSAQRRFAVAICSRIYATADGAGGGTSWQDPMGWSSALATAAADTSICEVWLQGDVTIGTSPGTIIFKFAYPRRKYDIIYG